MGRRLFGLGANLAILLTLAACGDGGPSGPITVTPTPSPSPSPTPSPTPAPVNTDLISLKADQTFQTWVTVYAFDFDTGQGAAPVVKADRAPAHDNVLSYTAANQSYIFDFKDSHIIGSVPASGTQIPPFGPATRNQTRTGAFTVYSDSPSGGMFPYNYRFTLLNAGSSNTQIALTYAGFGSTQLSRASPSSLAQRDYRPFAYGFPSTGVDIPTSGIVTYRGILRGTGTSSQSNAPAVGFTNRFIAVAGTFDATIDFSGRVLSGTVTLLEQTDPDNNPDTTVPLGTAALGSGVFTALPDLTGKVGSGSFGGFVAGPGAPEIAFTMAFDLPDPRNGGASMHIVASAAGKK